LHLCILHPMLHQHLQVCRACTGCCFVCRPVLMCCMSTRLSGGSDEGKCRRLRIWCVRCQASDPEPATLDLGWSASEQVLIQGINLRRPTGYKSVTTAVSRHVFVCKLLAHIQQHAASTYACTSGARSMSASAAQMRSQFPGEAALLGSCFCPTESCVASQKESASPGDTTGFLSPPGRMTCYQIHACMSRA
jgi:hypothetical protein